MELPPTAQQPPTQGLGYYQAIPNRPTQPVSIQVIAIIAIVLGALVVLCNGMGAIGSIVSLMFAHSGFMAQQPQMQSTTVNILNGAQSVIGLGLGAVLLTGGIGGVQLRPWARKLLVKWAVANLVFQVLTCALAIYITLAVTMPAVQMQMNRQGRGAVPAAMVSHFAPFGIAGVVLISLISCIFPCCVLYFWRQPKVIEAFESARESFG